MVFTKSYMDEPLKLPTLKGWHWRKNSLGSRDLFADLRRAGSTSPLGLKECHGCHLTLYDPFHLFAAGKSWHKGCFKCSACGVVLNPDKFWERHGLPYCENDYNRVSFNKCHACCTNIYQTPIKIQGRHYHPLCFTCRKCSQPLASYNYRERNGNFYCDTDYHNTFSPKCNACKKPIKDSQDATKTVGGIFHKEHFVCQECLIPLFGNEFRQVEGKVYCERDYLRLFAPKCHFCQEPVRQGGQRSFGKIWHTECRLRCVACLKFLTIHDYIRGADNKSYCRADWKKRFNAAICPTCTRPVYPSVTGKSVLAMGNEYHASCFYCKTCFTDLDTTSYWEVNGKPYCYKHYFDQTYSRWRYIPVIKETDSVTKTMGRLKLRSNSPSSRRSMSSLDRV